MKSFTGISDVLYTSFISVMEFLSVMNVLRLTYVFPKMSSLDEIC